MQVLLLHDLPGVGAYRTPRANGLLQILDIGVDTMTLSLDDEPGRIDDFEELCRPYGIVTVQRTGRVALPVLAKAATR